MEFKILGPLEVRRDGRILHIGSRRLQTLLAALLLDVNSSVPISRLTEQVWGGRAPAAARSTLQAYVYRLRLLLPVGAGVTLRTSSAGYLLEAAPEMVDLERFRTLVGQGRQALADRRLAEGASLLRTALALWRGDALAGLGDEYLRAEAEQLNALRLTVLEEVVPAELALGRHEQLLLELGALVTAHPYRERLWAWLMLALYRSGRQADALDAFHRARCTLIEGCGIEPGAELRAMQQQILAGAVVDEPMVVRQAGESQEGQGEHLTGPGPATTDNRGTVVRHPADEPRSSEWLPPAELPADIVSFTGRRAELAILRRLFDGRRNNREFVAVISGPGGVGKSALAVHAGHVFAACFPDGLLYANLQDGGAYDDDLLTAGDVLRRWLRYFGLGERDIPADVEGAAALFRSMTARKRVLLLLDNVAEAAQVRFLIPAGGSCVVLITTRRAIATIDSSVHIPLGPLGDDESVELLIRLLGRHRAGRESTALRRVIRLCGRLPLALRIVAARLAANPNGSIETLARRLSDETRRLDELTYADLAVRSSLKVSYRQLHRDMEGRRAADLLRLLGLLNRPHVDLSTARLLTRETPVQVEAMLDRLVESHLLGAPTNGRTYPLPELVRLFAREQALAVLDHGLAQPGDSLRGN